MSSLQCVDVLWRLGFKIADANDKRVSLVRADGRRVFVTRHKTLSPEEVRVILLVAGVAAETFLEVLHWRAESGEVSEPGQVITGIRAKACDGESERPPATRASRRTGG